MVAVAMWCDVHTPNHQHHVLTTDLGFMEVHPHVYMSRHVSHMCVEVRDMVVAHTLCTACTHTLCICCTVTDPQLLVDEMQTIHALG